ACGVCGGITHRGRGPGGVLPVPRPVIAPDIDRRKSEGLSGFGPPQTQHVCDGYPIAGHRSVVGDTPDHSLVNPAHAIASLRVLVGLRATTELHIESVFPTYDLPRVAEAQPLVRHLYLPTVTNYLIEDAELVPDAVAHGGNVERCQRVHVTRRQAAEAAIA